MLTELEEKALENRAEILCALNCLVKHLNDEEQTIPWLAEGVPDDCPSDLWYTTNEERKKAFADLVEDMPDVDYHAIVKLGFSLLRRNIMPMKYDKSALY